MKPFRAFVLRAPLLPFHELERFASELALPKLHADATDAELDAAITADRSTLGARLRDRILDPMIREAVRVAAPALEVEIEKWLAGTLGPDHTKKVERALHRYFARMAERATPFGLFAGCSVGAIGDRTDLHISAAADAKRRSSIDYERTARIAREVERDPESLDALIVRPGSSLYRTGAQLRCLKTKADRSIEKTMMIEPTEAIETTLDLAKDGAAAGDIMRALMADDTSIRIEEARAFILDLLESGVLESDVERPLTGGDSERALIAELERLPTLGRKRAAELTTALADLEAIDAAPIGSRPSPSAIHVELYKPSERLSLGPKVIGELARAVRVLHRLGASTEDRLTEFRSEFAARYEHRPVPIAEVVDDDSGIALPTRFQKSEWSARHDRLVPLLTAALREGRSVVSIEPGDLPPLGEDALPLPSSLAVFASIAARSSAACDAGDFEVWIRSASGPSAANLLGRFCHLDPRIRELTAEIVRVEESARPDAIHAEIVHLPEGIGGNLVARPLLRSYEIPYLGRSGAPRDRLLPIDDLYLSFERDRLILTSAKLGREIVPRLTTAHNFDRGPPLYRLLCMLQHQGTSGGVYFSWGPLAAAARLPRVVSGRAVLSLARWRLSKLDIEPLRRASGRDRFRAVRTLRDRLELPRWVEVDAGGKELLIDLDSVAGVESFVAAVKERETADLLELFPAPELLAAEGPEGRFVHEVIVPFAADAPPPKPARLKKRATPQRFLPGSEWLFAKIYCGRALYDRVLREVVRPIADQALELDAVESGFFIRYRDPKPHLRVRFRGDPKRLRAEVLPIFHDVIAPHLASGRVDALTFDTYDRELDRYGEAQIELVEEIFSFDSEAALSTVEAFAGEAKAEARKWVTYLAADRLLEDLGLDLKARLELCGTSKKAEPNRKDRAKLERWLARNEDDADIAAALEILRQRSEWMAEPIAKLRDKSIAPDLLHMTINRFSKAPTPAAERTLLDSLSRYYRSQLARTKR